MANISSVLKKKRDAEQRNRSRLPSGSGSVVTSPDDITTEGDGLPPVTGPGDGGGGSPSPTSGVKRHDRDYVEQSVWDVIHNIGRDPVVSIWVFNREVVSFGLSAFGSSAFGGYDGRYTMTLAGQEATVVRVNSNHFRVEWSTNMTGKVVAIG